MALPDSTAGTQLEQSAFFPGWLCYLDIDTDPLRVTTWRTSLTFTGTGDSELDGTYDSVDPQLVSVSTIHNSASGSETVVARLSGIVGPDTDLLNLLGDPTKWRGRTARLWGVIYNTSLVQQGAVWAFYTGKMSALTITGEPSGQVVEMEIENYLASLNEASNATYINSTKFDSGDNSGRLKIAAANGAKKGVLDIPGRVRAPVPAFYPGVRLPF